MPTKRTKSCENCRVSKTRCTLTNPCTRCSKRGTECCYSSSEPKPVEKMRFRCIRPAEVAPPFIALSVAETNGAADVERPVDCDYTKHAPCMTTVSTLGKCSDEGVLEWPWDLPEAENDSSVRDLELQPSSWSNLPSEVRIMFAPEVLKSIGILSHASSLKAPGLQPPCRPDSPQPTSLTRRMIQGRLAEYPRIIAECKQLPPFVHPPCWISGRTPCYLGRPHQCLPEILAVCANLCRMLYFPVRGSEGFVWQQIRVHVQQLRAEVSIWRWCLVRKGRLVG